MFGKNQESTLPCYNQGVFFDFVRKVPLPFKRTPFHNALRAFAEGQRRKLSEAISVQEAMDTAHDLQELRLTFATKFILYKQEIEQHPLQEHDQKAWQELTKVHSEDLDGGLSGKGVHFAILDLKLSLTRAGDVFMPSEDEIEWAFEKAAKKVEYPVQDGGNLKIEPKRRWPLSSLPVNEALKTMKHRVNDAYNFLKHERNRSDFRVEILDLCFQDLRSLKQKQHRRTEKLLEQEKYGDLKTLLYDLRQVDPGQATQMNVPVDEILRLVKDRIVGEVYMIQDLVDENWCQGQLCELHQYLVKLKCISRELAAYPEIVPEDLIKNISEKVAKRVKEVGRKAQESISRCSSLNSAMQADQIYQFGGYLIELGHILTHLGDFKNQAEVEVTHALNICLDRPWGPILLFQLGTKLRQGKIGDPKRDGTIAKVLINEFPHFNHVNTVMFNVQTKPTQKAIEDTLQAASLKNKLPTENWVMFHSTLIVVD